MSPFRNSSNGAMDAARLLQLCQQWTAHQTSPVLRPADPPKPAALQPRPQPQLLAECPPTGPVRPPPMQRPPYSEELTALRTALAVSKAVVTPPPPPAAAVINISPVVSPSHIDAAARPAIPPKASQPQVQLRSQPQKPIERLPTTQLSPPPIHRPSYFEELIALRTAVAASKAGVAPPTPLPSPAVGVAPEAAATASPIVSLTCVDAAMRPSIPPKANQPHVRPQPQPEALPLPPQPTERLPTAPTGLRLLPLNRPSYLEELTALRTALAASKAGVAPPMPLSPPAVGAASEAAANVSPVVSPTHSDAAARPSIPSKASQDDAQLVDLLATQQLDVLLSSFMVVTIPCHGRAF